MDDPFSDLIPQGGSQQGGGIPVTRYSIPKSALGGTQGDEMSDPNTARGVGISENELGPAVVAVNPSVYPYGTIFRNTQTNEVFLAGDKHGNENPRVVDLYSTPSAYKRESGTMPLVPIDRIATNQIPKSYSGVSELLANYGKVPEGEGAYTSLGKTQQQEDPFADLIPQAQGTNAPAQAQAQEQAADPFADLLPQQQGQAQPNPDAAFLTSPTPTPEQTGKAINLPAIPSQEQPKIEGQVEAGNIDINKRPVVKNADGTISTVRSISIGTDKGETLIPTVSEDGRIMSNDEAIAQYKQTGKNLGTFANVDAANNYAQQLHTNQAKQYAETKPAQPSYNPIENALRNFANTTATLTLNTVGGAVRYFNNAQQKDLKMAQEELAQAQASGESPEQISEIQNRINSFNEQIPEVQEAVKSITDLSNQYPEAYGVNPKDESTSAQIGRGLGQVASFIPTMALGPAGAPLGALQGASQAYEGTYQQTLQSLESQGVTDKALMEDKAQREASLAAVKSLPQLATYMVGGKLASAGVSKLLSTQKPLIQGAAGAVAGSIMNTAAGATIRKIMGESVMPTVESLTQDIAFGLFHGVGTGVEAQQKLRFEEQKRKLEEQKLGGPTPKVAPSTNPEVNKREAEILASADAQAPAPEVTLTTDRKTTTPDLNSLISEQLFLDEGSPEYAAIQKQIDELNKPTETFTPTSDLDKQLQELTDEQNRIVIEELPKYPEGSIERRQAQARIDEIRLQQVELGKQRELVILEETKPAEATAEAQPKQPNAVQVTSTEETMLRTQGEGQGEVVELPRVGEQNAKVPTEEAQAPKEKVAPIEAIHYSYEPFSLSKEGYKGKLKYGDNPVFGEGFYAMLPESEKTWTTMDRLILGKNRNEVTIDAKNPLIVTPDNLIELYNQAKKENSEKIFESWLSEKAKKEGNDALFIKGFFDKYPQELRDSNFVKTEKILRDNWTPQFEEGRTEGRFLNGEEFDRANEKAVREVWGMTPDELNIVLTMQDQIFVSPENSDIVTRKGGKEEVAPKKLENPYKDIERRYVNPDADAFKSTEELVIAVEEIANTENNQFLKDALTKYRDGMDIGEDPVVLIADLMAEVEREGNYREQGVKPNERGLPKADKKGREGYFISSDPVITYLNENRIRSKTEQAKYAKSRGEKLGGEYNDVPPLPPYHAAAIYGGKQTIDQAHQALVDLGRMPVDSKPRDLWAKIEEASRSAINAEKAEAERDAYEKEKTKKSKELEELRKTNPEAYKAQEEKDLQSHFNRMRRREGGFLEFPQPIQEAAIRFGESVRKAGMEFREWAKEMTSRLGEGVKGYLRQIWRAISTGGGRFLERKAERGAVDIGAEDRFKPKAPTEQEAFAKKAVDAFQRGRGTPITEEEMGSILARKFPGISPNEVSDLYATASGKPKPPTPYAGQTVAQETPEQISIRRKDQEDQVRRGILTATVPAGEGMSQVEITEKGKQNLAQGADPLQALEQAKAGNLESLITARAYYEGLQKQKSEILRKFGPNSPEYKRIADEAQTYYEGLREAGTAASTALSTFKGQNDLSDAADIATAYRSITGEEPTLAKHEQIRKVADKVDRTIKESDKASEDHKIAMDEGLAEVEVQTPTSVEEGRQQIADLSDAQGKKAKDEIDRLNNELEQTKKDLEEVRQAKATGQDAESLKAYYEAKLKDLQGQLESKPKFGKEVLDQAQKLVDKWRADRLEAEKLLAKQLSQLGSFPDVSIIGTIARIMRGHISELGLDFARSSKMILDQFGPKAEKYLKEAWAKADALIKGEDGGEKAVKTVRKATTKAKAKPVAKMTPEEKAAESLRKRIAQAEKKINDLNSGKITTPKDVEKVTSDEIKRLEDEYNQKKKELADARLKAKQRELFEQGKVGDDLNPEQVKTLWESAKRFYLDKGESDYDKMISDLASDFGLTTQQVRKAFGTPKGAKRASDEMYLKQRNRQMALDEAKRWLVNQKASWIGRVFGAAAEKTFKLAIFGHGTAFIGTHAPQTLYTNPKLALKAWLKGLSYSFTGKSGRIQNIVDNKDLINRPSWIVARKGGLENDPREIRREGATPSRSDSALAKALDTISGGRGFDALFHLRQDMFDQAWEQLSVTQRTPEMAEMYANAINNATGFTKGGRSSAGILQSPITKILFFAPKLIASRFKWLIQDPIRMLGTFGKMANPFLKVSPEERMSAIYEAKNKAKFLGVMTGTLLANQALLSLTGSNQSVNFLDPKKRDWLAYKGFGYDLATIGAFTRIFRLVAQEYNAVFGELSRWQKAKGGREQAMKDAVYTYLRSGFSPITRDIIVASTGKDYVGNTVPWSKEQPDRGRRKLTWRELIQEQFAPIPISEAATQKEALPAVVKASSAAFLGTRLETPTDIEEYEKSLKSKASSKSSKPFYQKSSQSKKSKPFYAK